MREKYLEFWLISDMIHHPSTRNSPNCKSACLYFVRAKRTVVRTRKFLIHFIETFFTIRLTNLSRWKRKAINVSFFLRHLNHGYSLFTTQVKLNRKACHEPLPKLGHVSTSPTSADKMSHNVSLGAGENTRQERQDRKKAWKAHQTDMDDLTKEVAGSDTNKRVPITSEKCK